MNLFQNNPAATSVKLSAAAMVADPSPLSAMTRHLLVKAELDPRRSFTIDEIIAALREAGVPAVDRIGIRQELERLDAERRSELVQPWPAQPGVNGDWPETRGLTQRRSVFKAAGAGTVDALSRLPRQVKVALERAGIEAVPIGSAVLAYKLKAAGIDDAACDRCRPEPRWFFDLNGRRARGGASPPLGAARAPGVVPETRSAAAGFRALHPRSRPPHPPPRAI